MTTPKQVNEPQVAYAATPRSAEADLKGALQAMRRAAQKARELARQTGTDLIVVRGGKLVRVKPQEKASS